MAVPLFQFQQSQGPIRTTHELFFYAARVADDIFLVQRLLLDFIRVSFSFLIKICFSDPH